MESLYRKYRPLTFDSVVGQQHIVSTLEHAVTEGRLSHAYLFCGPRGTGKTTMARILAKALLCEHADAARAQGASGCMPDGDCPECQAIAEGTHPDVYELDAASRTGVDNVREEIVNSVSFAPVRGAYKVYIIDEVHMLTTAAFNALLKTLEEPPAHVVFVLCTTDPQKILETILSRCQRFDFHRISDADLVARMRYVCEQEGFAFDDEALEIVAKHARGGMRDALSTLEQLSVFGDGAVRVADARALLGEVASTVLSEFACKIAVRDTVGLFGLVRTQVDEGNDLLELTRDLVGHMRDVYTAAIAGPRAELFDGTPEEVTAFAEEAKLFEEADRLARTLTVLDDAALEMRNASHPRLVLEIALTRLARPESDLTLEALAERIARLETQLAAGVPSGPMGAAGIAAATGSGAAGAAKAAAAATPVVVPAAAAAKPTVTAPTTSPVSSAPAVRPVAVKSSASFGEPVPWEKSARTASAAVPVSTPTVAASAPVVRSQPAATPVSARETAPVSTPAAAPQPARAVPQPAPVSAASQPAPAAPQTRQPRTPSSANPPSADKKQPETAQNRTPVAGLQEDPAASTVPAAPTVPTSAAADAGDLQRKWAEVVKRVVAAQPSRGALLQSARAQVDDGSTLTVGFPKGSSFALKMITRADSQSVVLPIVAEVFGERTVSYVMDGGDVPPAKPSPAAPAATPEPASAPAAAPASAAAPQPAPAAPQTRQPRTPSSANPPSADKKQPETAQNRTPVAGLQGEGPAATVTQAVSASVVPTPAVDQASGPTIVPEPDVDAQRKAWEDEQVPYDDSMIAAYEQDDEVPPFDVPAPASVSSAPAPTPAPATPAPTPVPAVPADTSAALPWSKPAVGARAPQSTPAAPAPTAPVSSSSPTSSSPFAHPGAAVEETPQNEEEAKALIGNIFGAGVVFKDA